jgi:DNA-binding transcriptional ArsR family regulator
MADALLDGLLGALADPTRRAILARLRQGEASVSQLARPAGITLTGMRKHLQVLERAGLVVTRKAGRTRWVRLLPAAFDALAEFVTPYRDLALASPMEAPYIDLSDMDVT